MCRMKVTGKRVSLGNVSFYKKCEFEFDFEKVWCNAVVYNFLTFTVINFLKYKSRIGHFYRKRILRQFPPENLTFLFETFYRTYLHVSLSEESRQSTTKGITRVISSRGIARLSSACYEDNWKTFYLWYQKGDNFRSFGIVIWRFKTMNYLENKTLFHDDNIHEYIAKMDVDTPPSFKTRDVDIPVMVSVRYVSYASTLQFFAKLVDADNKKRVMEAGEPLTLTRF
ncbi:hypothetical protein EDC94DRAFT_648082 [Helicostylum pulchrum]|nr:hypothetical protein EDC94DRAFT_648082 [Helicostylum pulchrum]